MNEFDKSGQVIGDTESSRGYFILYNFLRILWQRRYIILLGTAASVIIIAVFSFSMPSVYRSKTVVKPGLSHIDDAKRKWVPLATPWEMKIFIETELQYEVAEQKSKSKDTSVSFPLIFKVLADQDTNTVTVFCDSLTEADGVMSLQLLLDALKDHYQRRLQPFLYKFESGIALAQKELMLTAKDQGFINANLNAILKLFKRFNLQNDFAMGNSELAQKESRYIAEYTAIIDRITRLKQAQSANVLKSAALKDEIKKIELEKKYLFAMQVIQPPTTISVPNRRNLILNLIAAPVVGFCLMAFLTFFFEYIRNLIQKLNRQKYLNNQL